MTKRSRLSGLTLAATLLAACAATPTVRATDFYVAPNGKDTNPGTRMRPFATVERAQQAVRALKQAGPLKTPVTVRLKSGTYELSRELRFGPEDSGTAACPVTYAAAGRKPAVFEGGRRISGWRPWTNGIWQARVPEVAAGKWYFEQLFVNGRRATRARTPNKFWFYMQGVHEETLDPNPGRRAKHAQQTVTVRPQDFPALAGLSEADLKDVNLVVYHNWDNTRRFIDRIDEANRAIVTSGEGLKAWNPWKTNTPFVIENCLRALDEPGEWFLGRDGTLWYKPLPGEDLRRAEVIAPVREKFLVIEGDAAAGRFVEHLQFKDLSFQHAQWVTPPGGFEAAQAAAPIDAVVLADGARQVAFENCEIAHIGTYGIWFRQGCRDDVIRHCHIHDFGAGGVRVGEARIAANEVERTGHLVVDNNIIRHGGYIFPCAVGVWIGQSGDNQVTHNEIADLFYTGISAGWTWGYSQGLAKRNTFAFNHVHHLGWGLLSDMGGIYTLGPSEGTVVTNNVFHNIYAYSYGGWGMYTDEGSTGILFENNLVYDTKTGSFHQHYGKENIVRNNILVDSQLHQLQATRFEPHLSFTFDHNLVYWTNRSPLLMGAWDKMKVVMQTNLYWNVGGQEALAKSLAGWQARDREQGTVIADPLFANAVRRDFRLPPNSPALKLGFKPFDPSKAGVYGDRAWIGNAKGETYPPLEIAPKP